MDIVVIIVTYNGREYIGDCLRAVLTSMDDLLCKRVVVVDNASTDGTAEIVRREYPQVTLIEASGNLGFAAANNAGWDFAKEEWREAKYVYLLNQDTVVESGWLRELVKYCEAHPEVGSAQSKLLLHPRTMTINTMGNNSHFLGFGFPTGYEQADDGKFDMPHAINYASGAGVITRADLLRKVGLFEPEMFMYLEDADLSWKVKQLGYEIHVVPESRVYHKYKFNKGYRFYYELERNRWWLLLVYYKLATLLLLLPALVIMEAGQWLFAAKHGRLRDKLRSYWFFWQPKNIVRIWRLRREAQQRRTIPDRVFLQDFKGKIVSPELRGVLVNHLANPLLGAYWWVAKRLIWW